MKTPLRDVAASIERAFPGVTAAPCPPRDGRPWTVRVFNVESEQVPAVNLALADALVDIEDSVSEDVVGVVHSVADTRRYYREALHRIQLERVFGQAAAAIRLSSIKVAELVAHDLDTAEPDVEVSPSYRSVEAVQFRIDSPFRCDSDPVAPPPSPSDRRDSAKAA